MLAAFQLTKKSMDALREECFPQDEEGLMDRV